MSILKRIFFAVLLVIFSATVFSCSQKNYGYTHKSKYKTFSSTNKPVLTKNNPVEKKYILPNKKKRILGSQKPRI